MRKQKIINHLKSQQSIKTEKRIGIKPSILSASIHKQLPHVN